MTRKKPETPEKSSEPTPSTLELPANSRAPYPVVAIGASAGGLEALKQFFEAMPADAGMAFVVIQHLDPEKLSLMAEILARSTTMTVSQAGQGDTLRPNQVYVAPPGKRLGMAGGRLILFELPKERPVSRRPIDEFLRVLAEAQGERAIGIVLSGTGSDGALGLKAIKAAGGMAMAQKPEEAGYDGMPLAAINTGLVDYVLPVRSMPQELMHYVSHASYAAEEAAPPPSAELEAEVTRILELLARRQANDFSGYKRGTLVRRIERRTTLLHLKDVKAYGERLDTDDEELAALAKDLLIVVTGFFRDPEAFALLQAQVIAPLCQQAGPGSPIRVWVAGCATGEEAYSIAILILEELARCHKEGCGPQIFATDVDKVALQQARTGRFPESIEADVSAERLARFFDKEEGGYQIKKQVREAITFSEQDLIRDTPFSRIDLISCRNLLIYLKAETQRRIISLFHFALRPGGSLFLGNAETIGRAEELFRPLDKKWHIYRKIDTVRVPLLSFPRPPRGESFPPAAPADEKKSINLKAAGEREILRHFAPCGVIVNQAHEVMQLIGNTHVFLTLPEGDPSLNLLSMVPAVIRTPLRAMLQDLMAKKSQPSSLLLHLPDHEGRPYRQVQVSARRIEEEGAAPELYLVAFSDLPPECEILPSDPESAREGYAAHETIIKQLEEELLQTRMTWGSTIEQMEAANEELKANNEEAMSMNEEFQSTNEELETSKEELQAMNEELTTVNAALQEKLFELEGVNNDLDNLLASSDVAFLFLDQDLRIKRFTPAIQKLFHIIPADLGRSVEDFGTVFAEFSLPDEAKKVLADLIPSEKEVEAAAGRCFLQRVLPYRTRDNQIKGVLATFLDISKFKKKEEAIRRGDHIRWLNDILPLPMACIDADQRHLFANQAYRVEFDLDEQEVVGLKAEEAMGPIFYKAAVPSIRKALAGESASFERVFDLTGRGRRDLLCRFTPYASERGEVAGFFVTVEDVTERRQAEATMAWLSAIVESSHDAIISRDFDGTIRSWNKGAERMFGYAAAEMIGRKIDLLFTAEQPEDCDDFEILSRGAGEGYSEPCCKTRDGRVVHVLLTQSPILGQEGQPVAISVVMSDISGRKEMGRQVLEANRDLENKVAERTLSLQQHMAMLRRLALELTQTEQRERQRLATVLHNDLQQLLVAAGLRLERLANTLAEADKREAIQQVEDLISQAVAATRSLATDLKPPVLNSGNLVKSLHWLAEWLWKRFDFSLKIAVPEELRTDAIPDEDIVFLFDTARELCFNIVKHAHVKEGRMTLERTADDRLRLMIEDDGVGMDLEGRELTPQADGGLGLGAIRDRLALIGGELEIDSAVGEGFRAAIVLPYALTAAVRSRRAPKPRSGQASPAAPGRQANGLAADRKIRVMLVDDHAVVRDGLKMVLLDEEDIDVVGEAGDGEKAVKMAGKLLPDVIIMDVNMPKMNGIEATKLIKGEHPEICVIALSINDDPGTNNAMLEAGASAYMNKSGSADAVCEVIRACMRGPFDSAQGPPFGSA